MGNKSNLAAGEVKLGANIERVWIIESETPQLVWAAKLGRGTVVVRRKRGSPWREWKGPLFDDRTDAEARLAKSTGAKRYFHAHGEVTEYLAKVTPEGRTIWEAADGSRLGWYRRGDLTTRARAIKQAEKYIAKAITTHREAVKELQRRLGDIRRGKLPTAKS